MPDSNKLTIGIDARMYGIKHAGIGRYVENTLRYALAYDTQHQYVVFAHPDSNVTQLQQSFANLQIVHTDIKHYSLREQVEWPKLLAQYSLAVLHVPHFNIPVFTRIPLLVTIHDILWHSFKGTRVTTLPWYTYWLKYLGYRCITQQAVLRSSAIITPSDWVAKQLEETYGQKIRSKTQTIYEGIDHQPPIIPKNFVTTTSHRLQQTITQPYFLYVGSVYPHKNVETLLHAMRLLANEKLPYHLCIVSARNIFLDRIQQLITQLHLQSRVHLLGAIDDAQLAAITEQAVALVHPSLSEGFSFTGLEAMQQGCPVIAARATCLPEIYGDAALLLDRPKDANYLAQCMKRIATDSSLRENLVALGKKQAANYSWKRSAQKTVQLYIKIAREART